MMQYQLRSLLLCLVSGLLIPVANAQLTLRIDSPVSRSTISGLSAKASVTVTGTTDLSRLQVRLNNKDVATQLTSSAKCTASSCTATAMLGESDGLQAGANYLGATISTTAGAVAVDHTRFSVQVGVGATQDPSATLPTSIHVVASTSGVTFSNFPGYSGPVNYPQDLFAAGAAACPAGVPNFLILNASTLQPAPNGEGSWAFCYTPAINGSITGVLQSNWAAGSLVVAFSTANPQAIPYDFSSVGGPSQPDAADANSGFSIIGVLGAKPGTAFISYDPTGVSSPLDGVLEQVSTLNGSTYTYRQADAPGFTITPGATNSNGVAVASMPVGYHEINWGNYPPPNYQTPPAESNPYFENYGCSSRATSSGSGGVCVAYLDRRTLNGWSHLYMTNIVGDLSTSQANQQQLTSDLTTIPAQQNALVMFTTMGQAFDASQGEYITAYLAIAVQALGASRNDLNALLRSPNNSYSFIGTLDGLPITTQTYATTLHTQQAETGVLHGLLERNHQNLYTPKQVVAVPASLQDGSAPDYTRSDIPIQVGLARPVPWPLMDTAGHIAAYHAVSQYVIAEKLGITGPCESDPLQCDVRTYYGGNVQSDLQGYIYDSQPTYQANNSYQQSDLDEVRSQVQLEIADAGAVQGYFNMLQGSGTTTTTLTTIALSAAANQFQADMNMAVANPDLSSSLQLTADGLDTLSAVFNLASVIPGPQQTVMSVLSGLDWLASAIAQQANDSSTATAPNSSPYTAQLAALQSEASTASANYAIARANGTAALAGRIYGDWYKLETIGGLAKTDPNTAPDATGFYFSGPIQIPTSYSDLITMNARRMFVLQFLPQFYSIEPQLGVYVGGFASAPYPFFGSCGPQSAQNASDALYTYPTGPLPAYSWSDSYSIVPYRDYQLVDFFLARTTQLINYQDGVGSVGVWPSSFGEGLMGPPNSSDPALTRSLNISQTWFYDSNILPAAPQCPKIYIPPAPYQPPCGGFGCEHAGAPLQKTSTAVAGAVNAAGDVPVIATVTGIGDGTPSGTVTFAGSTATLATATLIPSTTAGVATATFTIPSSALPFKGGPLTASYGGDNFFGPSQSAPFTVPVPVNTPAPVTGPSPAPAPTPVASFALNATPSAVAITADGYITANVAVTPTGGFTGNVTLTCTASPVAGTATGATCAVFPGSLTLNGSSIQTAQIVLQPGSTTTAMNRTSRRGGVIGGAAFALLLVFLPISRDSRRRFAGALVVVVSLGAVLALNGCGTSAQAMKTYSVNVQATSGSQTQTSTFQVSMRSK